MMHHGRIAAVGTEQELEARLRGAQKLELTVRGEASALRAALASVPGTSELALAAQDESAPGFVRATVRVEAADVAESISRAVVSAGLGLCTLHPVRSGLESVFIELSGAAPPVSIAPAQA
jgi:hypothetical protein